MRVTTCPFCAEDVKEGAVGCAHCGRRLDRDVRRRRTVGRVVAVLLLVALVGGVLYSRHADQVTKQREDRQTKDEACKMYRDIAGDQNAACP